MTGYGMDAEFDSRQGRDFVFYHYVQASCGFREASCPVVTVGPSVWQQKDDITWTFFVLLVLYVIHFCWYPVLVHRTCSQYQPVTLLYILSIVLLFSSKHIFLSHLHTCVQQGIPLVIYFCHFPTCLYQIKFSCSSLQKYLLCVSLFIFFISVDFS